MRYLRLEDYIATLSESEKEQYRHLIEEYLERDTNIRKNCDGSRAGIEKLTREMEAYAEAIIGLKRSLRQLNSGLIELHSKINLCAKVLSMDLKNNVFLNQNYPNSLN